MSLRIRHFADVNPPTPEFDRLPSDAKVTFMPLEAVWSDDRLDTSRVRRKSEVSSGYTRFRNGDVILPKVTPTFEAGRSAIVQDLENGVGAGSTELHVLRPKPHADARFLRYILLSKPFLTEGATAFKGVAGLQRVPEEFVRDFPAPEIALEEQRRIADFLDAETSRLDKLAALHRESLLRLQERNQAVLEEEINCLTQGSTIIPLRRAIRRIEQGISPLCDNQPASGDDWGVLKVSAVRDGRFIPEENKRLPRDVTPVTRYAVRSGDLLVTRANTPALVGAAAVVKVRPHKLLLCDKIFRIELDPGLDKEFVSIVAMGRRIRDLCSSASHGTSQSMVNLKVEEIKAWPIPAVSLEQQRDFVNRVTFAHDQVERLRQKIERQLQLLSEMRQSLITAAVTGELDVTTTREVGSTREFATE